MIFKDNPDARQMIDKYFEVTPEEFRGERMTSEEELYEPECKIHFESPLGRMGLTKIIVAEIGVGDEGGPSCLVGFFSHIDMTHYELTSLTEEFDTFTQLLWKRKTPYDND